MVIAKRLFNKNGQVKLNAKVGEQYFLQNAVNTMNSGKPFVHIVLSSLTLDKEYLRSIKGHKHYETRCLWEVLKTKDPKHEVLILSARDLKSEIDHLLNFCPNRVELKKRIHVVKVDRLEKDNSLVEDVLQDPKAIEKVKKIKGQKAAILYPFVSTHYEKKFAQIINVPIFSSFKDVSFYQTKSGNRSIFHQAGLKYPRGKENIFSEEKLKSEIIRIWQENPKFIRMMIKLDEGFSGKGNALLSFPMSNHEFMDKGIVEQNYLLNIWLNEMKFFDESCNWPKFRSKICSGVIIEEFIEGEHKKSPSFQGLIGANGEVEALSTHEQILDKSGQVYLGCEFPSSSYDYEAINSEGMKAAKVLSKKGYIGPFAVDFLVSDGKMYAIEINLRQGGTTHPYQTAKMITDSSYDSKSGRLLDKVGKEIFYKSNDNFMDERLKKVDTNKLLEAVGKENLLYKVDKKEGVIFHLLSGINENSKFGYLVISQDKTRISAIEKEFLNFVYSYL